MYSYHLCITLQSYCYIAQEHFVKLIRRKLEGYKNTLRILRGKKFHKIDGHVSLTFSVGPQCGEACHSHSQLFRGETNRNSLVLLTS